MHAQPQYQTLRNHAYPGLRSKRPDKADTERGELCDESALQSLVEMSIA